MKPRIPKGPPQPVRKAREGNDAKHLAMIRLLPCVLCGQQGITQAHHLLRTGDPTQRGTGRKPADKFCIPLCVHHHTALHAKGDEEAFLMETYGVDGRALAAALWAERGNLDGMDRVEFRFRQEAALKMKGAA